jgi:hypothetical protein
MFYTFSFIVFFIYMIQLKFIILLTEFQKARKSKN